MTKDKAMVSADEFYKETGMHAFVVEKDDEYDWHSTEYFQVGGEYGFIVYGTNWEENF